MRSDSRSEPADSGRMKNKIGIMQGRLLPPIDRMLQAFPLGRWPEEFSLAALAGLDCIEWIFDLGTEQENPIWNEAGLKELRTLQKEHGIDLKSVCADYFMRRPLLNLPEEVRQKRLEILFRLIGNAAQIGVTRIVIPFVDDSSIKTRIDLEAAAQILKAGAKHAAQNDMELHLETDLGPSAFTAFLDLIAAENVKVNYDSGNSASLGFAPREELAAYGDRLGSVHIKDRKLNGGSVPLGTGNADFDALFNALGDLSYQGDFILQAARDTDGAEVELARKNRLLVENWVDGSKI